LSSSSWTIGAKQQFELVLDFDTGAATIKIDGTEYPLEQKLETGDGLRIVQFCDGTGLAYYGSKFTATLGQFKMVTLP
jgi:hypothetical protein